MLCIQFVFFVDWELLLNLEHVVSSLGYTGQDAKSELRSENVQDTSFLSLLE